MSKLEELERRLDKGLELGYATVAAMRIETIARDAIAALRELDTDYRNTASSKELLEMDVARLRARLATIQNMVNEQAEDQGLWFLSLTAPEAYLQQELRRLHAVIEGAQEDGE